MEPYNDVKDYTVVGVYEPTDEYFVDHVQAVSPRRAADTARADHDELRVVAVFDGLLTNNDDEGVSDYK